MEIGKPVDVVTGLQGELQELRRVLVDVRVKLAESEARVVATDEARKRAARCVHQLENELTEERTRHKFAKGTAQALQKLLAAVFPEAIGLMRGWFSEWTEKQVNGIREGIERDRLLANEHLPRMRAERDERAVEVERLAVKFSNVTMAAGRLLQVIYAGTEPAPAPDGATLADLLRLAERRVADLTKSETRAECERLGALLRETTKERALAVQGLWPKTGFISGSRISLGGRVWRGWNARVAYSAVLGLIDEIYKRALSVPMGEHFRDGKLVGASVFNAHRFAQNLAVEILDEHGHGVWSQVARSEPHSVKAMDRLAWDGVGTV